MLNVNWVVVVVVGQLVVGLNRLIYLTKIKYANYFQFSSFSHTDGKTDRSQPRAGAAPTKLFCLAQIASQIPDKSSYFSSSNYCVVWSRPVRTCRYKRSCLLKDSTHLKLKLS